MSIAQARQGLSREDLGGNHLSPSTFCEDGVPLNILQQFFIDLTPADWLL